MVVQPCYHFEEESLNFEDIEFLEETMILENNANDLRSIIVPTINPTS